MSQTSGRSRGVFDDFSFTTVAASALTAATSFLLTSRIGLAGSMIGAVAAAVISTVSTQVYKGMLTASADRIRAASEPVGFTARHVADESTYAWRKHETVSIARRLVGFAVCASLVAVLASAMLIAMATRGAGLGPTSWEPMDVVETVDEVEEKAKSEAKEVLEVVEETAAADEPEVVEEAGPVGNTDASGIDAEEPTVESPADTAEEVPAEPAPESEDASVELGTETSS